MGSTSKGTCNNTRLDELTDSTEQRGYKSIEYPTAGQNGGIFWANSLTDVQIVYVRACLLNR